MVVFERCVPDSDKGKVCAGKEEISDWMQFKYIMVAANEENFLQSNIEKGIEPIEQFTKFSFFAVT